MSVTVIAMPARAAGGATVRRGVCCLGGAAAAGAGGAAGFCVDGTGGAPGFCVDGVAGAAGFCVGDAVGAAGAGFDVDGACAKAMVPVSNKLGRSSRSMDELSPGSAYIIDSVARGILLGQ
jgi:hypothetical protein